MFKRPVIVLCGPTATGKTCFSVALAKALQGVVLSADSRLVYRGLDIGTAKPTMTQQGGVPHYLLDVALPTDVYTVVQYQQAAMACLQALPDNQPVVVTGGTGLYLQALFQQHIIPAVPPNPELRQQLALTDVAVLYTRLQQQDLKRAKALYPQDKVRIIRALEIIAHTGQPVPQPVPPTNLPGVLWLGLHINDTAQHRQIIAQRVHSMMADGWLNEVQHLAHTYGPQAHALQVTHGYPELLAYQQGQCTYTAAIDSISLQVQQYARRQRTWFKRNPDIKWADSTQCTEKTWLKGAIQDVQAFFH